VSRDLSSAVLLHRLKREAPAEAKRGGFAFAVDPRDEVELPFEASAAKTETKKPSKKKGKKEEEAAAASFNLSHAFEADVLSGAKVAYGKEWAPALLGSQQVPSTAQWQRTLLRGASFLYHGPGSLLAQVGAEHIAPLNLRGCGAAVLFDRLESSVSNRRLAQEANQKSAAQLELEAPHAIASLLSLAGVRSVLLRPWAVSPSEGRDGLNALMASLGGGASLGEALIGTLQADLRAQRSPSPTSSRPSSKKDSRPGTKESKRGSKPDTPKGGKRPTSPARAASEEEPVAPPPPPVVLSAAGNTLLYGLPSFKLV